MAINSAEIYGVVVTPPRFSMLPSGEEYAAFSLMFDNYFFKENDHWLAAEGYIDVVVEGELARKIGGNIPICTKVVVSGSLVQLRNLSPEISSQQNRFLLEANEIDFVPNTTKWHSPLWI